MIKKQAVAIQPNFEKVFRKNIFNEQTPDQLSNIVLSLFGINCGLHTSDEYYDQMCNGPIKLS